MFKLLFSSSFYAQVETVSSNVWHSLEDRLMNAEDILCEKKQKKLPHNQIRQTHLLSIERYGNTHPTYDYPVVHLDHLNIYDPTIQS